MSELTTRGALLNRARLQAVTGAGRRDPGGGFVGIHGTNLPDCIPGRVTHGCNPAIRRLARLMPVGAPIRIL